MTVKNSARKLLNVLASQLSKRVSYEIFREPIVDQIQDTRSLAALDIRKFAQIVAGLEAGEFYCEHLYNVPFFQNYVDHVAAMAGRAASFGNGLILEFGVASGVTLRAIAGTIGREAVGFDSFKGLPTDWREGVAAGAFACSPPELPLNASLKIGMIEDTLPRFLAEHPTSEINFIHVDTDLYEPAKQILELCEPRLQKAIIVFDELINFPGWRDHEWKALSEFMTRNSGTFDFEYVGLGGTAAVSLKVTRKN